MGNQRVYTVKKIHYYRHMEIKTHCITINNLNKAVDIARDEKTHMGKRQDVVVEDDIGNEIWF